MTDFEAFEPGHDGLYAVCLYNRDKVPESQIVEDFSKFGEIMNLRQLPSGFCFIRYSKKDEAINCVKEMANSSYSVKIADSNKKDQSKSKWNSGGRNKKTDGGYVKDKQNNNNNNYYNQNKNSPSEDINKKLPQENSYPRPLSSASHNDLPVDICEGAVKSVCISSMNQNSNVERSTSPPPLKIQSSITWEKELQKLPFVPAVEVIVANIPRGIYQAELYDLCAVGEPLHIEMNITPDKYKIPFAHVYVKNSRLAEKLITDVDGMLLNNNIIIAALPETILRDINSKHVTKYL